MRSTATKKTRNRHPSMEHLATKLMKIALHHPEDGFYRGTRFDRSGVFDSLEAGGTELCGRWFPVYDPFMHDAVCGPAEEFAVLPGPKAKGTLLKIGVGLLRDDGEPYDRFRLYEIRDAGKWDVGKSDGRVVFRHCLQGIYEYTKEIVLTGETSFSIRHVLAASTPIEGEVYNHNFFTMGRMAVGPERVMVLPFTPSGSWRSEYDSVRFSEDGVRFSRNLRDGESVYSGDIHEAGKKGMPYDITLREGGTSVHIRGDVPVTRTVLWANHRIACMEPYNDIAMEAGGTFKWNVNYTINI